MCFCKSHLISVSCLPTCSLSRLSASSTPQVGTRSPPCACAPWCGMSGYLAIPTLDTSQSQWSECLLIFSLAVGFPVGVCTCATLCFSLLSILREIIVAAEQLAATRLQAHSSTFQKFVRGHVIPEQRWVPLVRVPLELRAALLDSGVQGLLGDQRAIRSFNGVFRPNIRVSWSCPHSIVVRFFSQ